MGVICLSERSEDCWQVAGWAFRQLLDDVILFSGNNPAIKETLEEAKTYDALSLYEYPQDLAQKILIDIRLTIRGLLAGDIESGIVLQSFGDANTRDQYIASLQTLLSIIEGIAPSKSGY